VIDRALSLAPDVRRRLVAAIRSRQIREPLSSMSVLRVVGDSKESARVFEWLSVLQDRGVDLAGAAFALDCVEECERRASDPVVVWSGPEVPGVHSRDTRRVFEELFRTAQESLWISTYALFDGAKMFEIVANRMDEEPDLEVTILLNLMHAKGLKGDDAILEFARKFWRKDWPGERRPRVFYDARALEEGAHRAVLHAKGVVQDSAHALITSANLTGAAFDRNIELGILLKDRATCRIVVRHFQRLIEEKLLSPLP
jgi:phosphatidylserine/phosphatidylglycerophosphate/cardiolipin synthase-like enzyme